MKYKNGDNMKLENYQQANKLNFTFESTNFVF